MNPLLRAIVEPWSRDALSVYWPIVVEGALVAVALGLVGSFLVVRGMSLLGDALSHSVLPGIVIGFLIGGSLHSPWILIGATIVGIGAAVLVQTVHDQSRVKEDASLGIVFTALFAIGVVMINLYAGQADLDPGCVLYGNIEHFVLQPHAIWPMAAILAALLLLLLVFYRHLLVSTFDPGLAVSLGIPAAAIHYGLMAALSLTVVASFEAVGAILAVALLIMPGASARLWTDRMPVLLLLAAAHGILSTLLGYWLSHPAVLDTSAAGAICVAGFALFLGSWVLSPSQGVLARALLRRRMDRSIAEENVLRTVGEFADAGSPATEPALAAALGVQPSVLSNTLARLATRNELSRTTTGGVSLTNEGRDRSRRLVRAHELWEKFLRQEVGLPADHVHDPAEWVEHHLSEEKLGRLEQMLADQPQQQGGDDGPAPPPARA